MMGRRPASNFIAGLFAASFLFGCSGDAPSTLGVNDGRLASCPDRPNCVASDAGDEAHKIEPLRFSGPETAAWATLQSAVSDLPRTTIVTDDGAYMHAEAKSRIFGFVDDLEFLLRPEDSTIAIRSAARTGYSDLGVNAERLESLRSALKAEGVLR